MKSFILSSPIPSDSVLRMKSFLRLRRSLFLAAGLAWGIALPLLCGCDDVEGTDPSTAKCTLAPTATFSVVQDPPPEVTTVTTTNIEDGVTNTTTHVTETTAITTLSLAATASGGTTWTLQASDNDGGLYSGTASGPAVYEPGGGNTYPAGATVATFSLQCSSLVGTLTAVALVPIPLDVVRTTSTNGTNVVVGRHGEHSLTPQNTEYRLAATVISGGDSFTLTGRAPAPAATIEW